MSNLVRNPEDRFFQDAAHIMLNYLLVLKAIFLSFFPQSIRKKMMLIFPFVTLFVIGFIPECSLSWELKIAAAILYFLYWRSCSS